MNIETYSTGQQGLTLESEERTLLVAPVTDSIVRVVYTGDEVSSAEDSYMIESLPESDVDWTYP